MKATLGGFFFFFGAGGGSTSEVLGPGLVAWSALLDEPPLSDAKVAQRAMPIMESGVSNAE